jgi:hypothetical protein
MWNLFRYIFFFMLPMCCCSWGWAQQHDSTATGGRDSTRLSMVGFDRTLDTYVWTGLLRYSLASDCINLQLNQNYRSRLIRSTSTSITDEYTETLQLRMPVAPEWEAVLQNASTIYSDNQGLDLGNLIQDQLLGGLQMHPDTQVTIKALAGIEFNTQFQEHDKGFRYAGQLVADHIALEEFTASLDADWSHSSLGRRSLYDGSAKSSLVRDFGGGVSDSVTVSYLVQQREFYTTMDSTLLTLYDQRSNIFKRLITTASVSNALQYAVWENARFSCIAGLSEQWIERGYRYKNLEDPQSITLDTRIQEFQASCAASLQWSLTDWLRTNTTMSYQDREERHDVVDMDIVSSSTLATQRAAADLLENIGQRTTLSSVVDIALSDRHSLRLSASASIFRYDTPDTLNTDDRDELLYVFGIESSHRLSGVLTLTTSLTASLYHLVYLSRYESANNNWNRVLNFSPAVLYHPSPEFRMSVYTSVLANYTVSDYGEIADVQSYSFRQALWGDSGSYQATKNIRCDWLGSLRIFERGILSWGSFSEAPQTYVVEKMFWPKLIYTVDRNFLMGVGYKYFSQVRYTYSGDTKTWASTFSSIGPTVSLDWRLTPTESICLNGWRECQLSSGSVVSRYSNVMLSIQFLL